jgi:hypothetical protein
MISSENGNETSGSTKGRECFDKLSDYQLLKEVTILWGPLVWYLKVIDPGGNSVNYFSSR